LTKKIACRSNGDYELLKFKNFDDQL